MTGPVHALFTMSFDEALPDWCAVVADNQQSSKAGTPKLLTSIQLWIKCDTMQYMSLLASHERLCSKHQKAESLSTQRYMLASAKHDARLDICAQHSNIDTELTWTCWRAALAFEVISWASLRFAQLLVA